MSGPARGGVRRGLGWSAIDFLGSEALGFVLLVLLARMLTPFDYGLVAILGVFLALARVFTDAGLSKALIRRPANSADDETTAFALNIAGGLAMAGLLCLVSPLVARLYGQPLLVPLLCASSLKPVLSSLCLVQQALLTRAMDFRTQMICNLVANLLAGAVAVAMALAGHGVWSLVIQGLLQSLFRSLLLWWLRPWRPRGRVTRASIAALLPFSWRVLATDLLSALFDQLNQLLLGLFRPPAELGAFTRAQQLQLQPSSAISTLVSRVSLPALARMQEDRPRAREAFRRLLRVLAGVHMPAMAGLAAVAPTLVSLLLTDRWASCVPILRVLIIVGMLYPLNVQHLQLMTALGEGGLLLRTTVVRRMIMVALLLAACPYGPVAVAAAMAVNAGIALAIHGWVAGRLIGYGWRDQAADLLPGLVAAAACGGGAWVAGFAAPQAQGAALAAEIAAGLTAYCLAVLAMRRGPMRELVDEASRLLGRRR